MTICFTELGSLVYGNGAGVNILSAGTENQFLVITSSGIPAWESFDWQDWEPSWSAEGSMTVSNEDVNTAHFMRKGELCICEIEANVTLGGTASNKVFFTLPISGAAISGTIHCLGVSSMVNNSTWQLGPILQHYDTPGLDTAYFATASVGNFSLTSTDLRAVFVYRVPETGGEV